MPRLSGEKLQKVSDFVKSYEKLLAKAINVINKLPRGGVFTIPSNLQQKIKKCLIL